MVKLSPVAHDTRLIELSNTAAEARVAAESAALRSPDTAAVAAARQAYTDAVRAVNSHETGYTGWSRYYLVTNTGGHIHSTTGCSTCRPSTRFAMLSDMSGLAQRSAVDAYGEVLCTVCFPTAPSAWTTGTLKSVAADRAARRGAAEERRAAKLAKALLPDGSGVTVRCGYGTDTITTLTAAERYLSDGYTDSVWCGRNVNPDMGMIADMVAARTGRTVAEVLDAARERAVKRVGKDLREARTSPLRSQFTATPEAAARVEAEEAAIEVRLAGLKAEGK